jgi:hypothetical protein
MEEEVLINTLKEINKHLIAFKFFPINGISKAYTSTRDKGFRKA